MKPAAQIYQTTLAALECAPHEAVFIDDNQNNIIGANQLGLATIHFKPPINLPHALAQFNIDI